jgi:hypothetical protein
MNPRDRRKVSARLSEAYAIVFAALFATQSVLSLLHLSYASHQHRFNPATGLYEDVIFTAGESDRADGAVAEEN